MRVSRTRKNRMLLSFVAAVVPLFCLQLSAADTPPPATKPSEAKPAAKSKLQRITIYPQQAVLAGARNRQGLRITGEFADGTLRDVTSECQFRSADTAIASVTPQGMISPVANGSVAISATFQGVTVSTALTVNRVEDNSYNFSNDVLPVMSRLTCNQMGCHGSPKGKKRLHLSLFSADPHYDFLQITNAKSKLIDPTAPDESWLLLKAICEEDHGGSDLTEAGTPEYNLLLDWIKNSAPEGKPTDAKLVYIEVFPKVRNMLPNEKQRMLVEAHYSDGSMRDVTMLSSIKSNEEAVAKVDSSGVVEGTGYGEAVFMVGYGGKLATSRVTSSQPASVPFPDVPVNNKIDELVYAKLRSLNVIPSDLCSDAEFLRRVYLDVIGVLPTPDEARAFLADTNPDKRSSLIDVLLDRPEYADFYSVKWGDILQINSNNPARLQTKGVWTYHRWLWNALDKNMPLDQFVHETLTARGSGYRNGPANFFRVGDGPQGMAEHASTAFLGVRLDCAHCHNHPFEHFTLIDNLGMAAFFTKVRIKRTREQDEEVIYLTDTGSIKNPDTNQVAAPKFLGGAELAATERAAARKANAELAVATKIAASKAAVAKSATAKATAQKIANDKLVATKTVAAKKASDLATAAKATADKLTVELDAAKKTVAAKPEAEREAATKALAGKVAATTKATQASASAQAVATKTLAEKAAVVKRAAEQAVATKVVVTTANTEQATAAKVLSEMTRAARTANAAVAAVENSGDLRVKLADWIASPENPYFSKHMANRAWTWLLGRGIVNEPDDFRSTNPASNKKLLDHLAGEFVRSGYDMKAMFRQILNSRTYQLSSQPNQWNRHDNIHYSHYHLKRLSAEQLAGAISEVTGVDQKYSGLPLGTRATQLPDVAMRSEFLDLFGRPKRATPVESERTCDTHIGQSLQMISSEYIAAKLRSSAGRAAKLASSKMTASEAVDELYLATLSRLPTDAERKIILAEPIPAEKRREKFEDLAWVLMNTKEFLFNH